MISNKIMPAHILRLYVWELMQLNVGMEKINGLVPVLPIEDEPKVADSGKAYIIYGYAESEAPRLDQIRRGVFSARIIAPSFAQLGQISNVLAGAFESRDIATEAVNRWSSTYPNNALVGIRFTELKTSYVEGGEAPETEGGPVDAVVNVSYQYITDLEVTHPAGALGGTWT